MHAELPLWQVSSNWFIHVLYSIYIQNMVDESGGEYSVYRRAGCQLGPVGEEVGGHTGQNEALEKCADSEVNILTTILPWTF